MDDARTQSEGSRNNSIPSQKSSIVLARQVDQVSNPDNPGCMCCFLCTGQQRSFDPVSNQVNGGQEPLVDPVSNHDNPAPRIQTVEWPIRLVQESAYLPCHVAIGPCNRGRGMDRMEDKQKCLTNLLNLVSNHTQQQITVDELVNELRRMRQANGHRFYHLIDRRLDETSDDFLNMLVQDGCYILDCFLKMEDIKSSTNVADLQRFLRTDTNHYVVRDVLYIFENQIPFDVLETLYLKVVGQERAGTLPLRRLMFEWVLAELEYQKCINSSQHVVAEARREPHWQHLLGLVHNIITASVRLQAPPRPPPIPPPEGGSRPNNNGARSNPTPAGEGEGSTPNSNGARSNPTAPRSPPPEEANDGSTIWHRATDYVDYAAVSFVHRPLDGIHACSILDVNLGRLGRLEIPRLTIYTGTLPMLLNLMVLERYDQGIGNKHVTSYCFFLSKLAREVQDVAFLSRRRIIDNNLQNDNVAATRMSQITSGFSFNLPETNYLQKTAEALDSRFRSRIYPVISWLKLNKLRNPAMAAVSVGGIGIFVFTIVQAVYAIKTYKRGH